MRNVLILLPNLDPSGAGSQALLLARHLPRDRFAVRVAALGGDGLLSRAFAAEGVVATAAGMRSVLDPAGWKRLLLTVRNARPDVIHAWRWPAVAAGAVLARKPFLPAAPALIASEALRGEPRGLPGRLATRRILAGARRIAAGGPAEATALRAAGLPDPCVVVVPPAVEVPAGPAPDRAVFWRRFGLPEGAPVIVAAGRFDRDKDFHTAIWAYDILRYRFPELRLVLCGEGLERPRLETFVGHIMGHDGKVRFAGWRDDLPGLLRLAEAVWVTDRGDGGRGVALEALAAGRPLVATARPGLVELLAGSEAGSIVAPGDRVGLARETFRLLTQPSVARHAGEAGRHLVGLRYPPARLAEGYGRLYEG
jgi:glycosyltransferase involved in cell wall biosynthesis